MTLAAFDGDALYQLVILALLGGGGLVKKFFEARQGGQDDSSQGSPYKFKTHRDEGPLRRSSGTRRSADRPLDPWVASIEEGGVPAPETSGPQELVLEPILVQEPVDAAAATPEVSIEGGALEEFSLEGGSFDLGTASKEPWEPGGRIRESVFADIEQSVAHDITEHVDADMAGGVRGEAGVVNVPVHKRLRARRGWRDAVIVAEVLGSPVSMRGPASQPAGLRDE